MTPTMLIVPDNNPDKEFQVASLDEAHRICRERGYKKFDVWTAPYKDEVMAYRIFDESGEFVGLIGARGLDRDGVPPGLTIKPGITDDGSTMIDCDILVKSAP